MHKNPRFNILQAATGITFTPKVWAVIQGQRTDAGHMARGATIVSPRLMTRAEAIALADRLEAQVAA